jgi:hypothetical protein
MNCKTARSLFDDHVDGALGAARERELAAHVAGCAACREELAGLERAVEVLALGDVGPASREHVAAVMAAVRSAPREEPPVNEERRERRVLPWWWLLVSHAAAAAVVAAIVWGLVRERGAAVDAPGPIANEGDSAAPAPVERREELAEDDAVAAAPRYVFVPYELRVVQRAAEAATDREAADAALAEARAAQEAARRAAEERLQLAALALEERAARVGAAFTFALERGARGVERLARAAEEHTVLLAEQVAALRTNTSGDDAAQRDEVALAPEQLAPRDPLADDASFMQRGPLAITRDAGGVVLSLRGELDEVVPALIAQLDSSEADVRAAVRRRLEAYARELGVPAPTAAAANTSPSAPWYRSDRGRAADAHTRHGDEAEAAGAAAWRDWWSDARRVVRALP